MDEVEAYFRRIDEDSVSWNGDDLICNLDNDDYETAGFYDLSFDEMYAVHKTLGEGLAAAVAAMWGVNGILPADIIDSRMQRFPQESGFAARRIIRGLPEDSRWPVVNTVYFLYRFAVQRDEDFHKRRT
jgi:hypothetical protein